MPDVAQARQVGAREGERGSLAGAVGDAVGVPDALVLAQLEVAFGDERARRGADFDP